jgi:hypothetical protein
MDDVLATCNTTDKLAQVHVQRVNLALACIQRCSQRQAIRFVETWVRSLVEMMVMKIISKNRFYPKSPKLSYVFREPMRCHT